MIGKAETSSWRRSSAIESTPGLCRKWERLVFRGGAAEGFKKSVSPRWLLSVSDDLVLPVGQNNRYRGCLWSWWMWNLSGFLNYLAPVLKGIFLWRFDRSVKVRKVNFPEFYGRATVAKISLHHRNVASSISQHFDNSRVKNMMVEILCRKRIKKIIIIITIVRKKINSSSFFILFLRFRIHSLDFCIFLHTFCVTKRPSSSSVIANCQNPKKRVPHFSNCRSWSFTPVPRDADFSNGLACPRRHFNYLVC